MDFIRKLQLETHAIYFDSREFSNELERFADSDKVGSLEQLIDKAFSKRM